MLNRTTCRGFTVQELLISVSIVSILLATAVPAMNATIKNNRISTQVNAVVEAIHFARSEATKRGTRVIMCRSADPSLATPACSGTTNTWTTGFLIFADDGNNTNNTYDAGNDTLLRLGSPGSSGLALLTNATMDNTLEFNSDGSTNEGGNVAIMAICDDRNERFGRQITVPASGIPRMISGSISDCSP